MKLIKIIQRFFLFVSALLLTLTVSINHINAQTIPSYREFINVDIAVNSGNSSSQSLDYKGSSENREKLPSVMYLMYIPMTLLVNVIFKKLDGTFRYSKLLPFFDNYEIAYLAGGKKRAIDLAIVNLIDSGSITFNSTTGKFSTYNIKRENSHSIEKNLVAKIDGRARVDIYNDMAENTLEKIRKNLERNKLIFSQQQSNYALLTSADPVILATILMLFQNTLFGIIFILINLILLSKIGDLFFPSTPYRSQHGDYILKQLRKQNSRTIVLSNISLGFALFGLRVIPLGHIETALTWTPPYCVEDKGTNDRFYGDFSGDRSRDCG